MGYFAHDLLQMGKCSEDMLWMALGYNHIKSVSVKLTKSESLLSFLKCCGCSFNIKQMFSC